MRWHLLLGNQMKLSANVKINLLITLNDLQQQEPTIHKVCELRKR